MTTHSVIGTLTNSVLDSLMKKVTIVESTPRVRLLLDWTCWIQVDRPRVCLLILWFTFSIVSPHPVALGMTPSKSHSLSSPLSEAGPSSSASPIPLPSPVHPEVSGHRVPDRRELDEMEEAMAEQLAQQQQQQRHQYEMGHTHAPYGASGTGAYC